MNERIQSLKNVLGLAEKFIGSVPQPVPPGWLWSLVSVRELIKEVDDAEGVSAQKAKLATQVLEPFHVETIMAVSTGHVSDDTMKKLTSDAIPQLNVKEFGAEGVMVYLFPDQGSWNEVFEANQNLLTVPDDVFAAMAFARMHGCTWLLLDADAPLIPALAQFEW